MHVLRNVRHRPDVILVAVGQHERGDPVFLQLPQIGDDEVHPEQFGSGNSTPASTRIAVSPHAMSIMFIPNSPSPPRGISSSGGASVVVDTYPQSKHRMPGLQTG